MRLRLPHRCRRRSVCHLATVWLLLVATLVAPFAKAALRHARQIPHRASHQRLILLLVSNGGVTSGTVQYALLPAGTRTFAAVRGCAGEGWVPREAPFRSMLAHDRPLTRAPPHLS